MFEIIYNGERATNLGVAVTTRPNVPAPKPRGEFVEIAGRDGALLVTDGTFNNITIPVKLNFVRAQQYWWDTYRRVKNWITGSGKLNLSDDFGWFYKVKQASLAGEERKVIVGGKVEARFICDPYQYAEAGQFFLPVDEVVLNPYAVAHPTYKIEATGTWTLEVNGATATGTGSTIIDTDKMLAYYDKQTRNNTVRCEYEDLYLKKGRNEIGISTGTIEVLPNWRSL